MRLALPLLFTLILSAESLWLFALSAHIARFMERAAPVFWAASLCAVWLVHFRTRTLAPRPAALRALLAGAGCAGAGAVLGAVAFFSA